jgi:hypothetical protein
MADWKDVTLKAEIVITDAQNYLNRRIQTTTNPMEIQRLHDWSNRLNDISVQIINSQPEAPPGPSVEGAYEVVLEQLENSRQQILKLHETFAYADVEFVLSDLHQNLTMLTGPMGPGTGPRTGPGGSGKGPRW